jgi:adenylate cyclase
MVIVKEDLQINRVHDNDKYIAKRIIVEELTGEELVKIYKDIDSSYKNVLTQLDDMPKQFAEREKVLRREKDMLETRREVFEKHASKIEEVTKEIKYDEAKPSE